jgi:hypothetical protein
MARPVALAMQRGHHGVHHAAEAGGHREAGVVGFRRQQQRHRVGHVQLAQLAFGVAQHDQVAHLMHQRFGQFHRGQALGAVAGAAERHQQQRLVRVQVQVRRADDVGGRHRVHAGGQLAIQQRRHALADVGGTARAGKDHPRGGVAGQSAGEDLDPLVQVGDQRVGLFQHARLLRDFPRGGDRTGGDQCGFGEAQIISGHGDGRHGGSRRGRH